MRLYLSNDIDFFKSHSAHLRFITDLLLKVKVLRTDQSILSELSNLIVRDYIFNEKFKNDSLSFGDDRIRVYEILMSVCNYQIAFCGQIGNDANKIVDCYELLDSCEDLLKL